jgi:UDP-N-acetyl-D-galactosamine dehydrogenase
MIYSLNSNIKVAVIGLGYVGLPLAVAFGEKYETLGFDISDKRIKELNDGQDVTLEVSESELRSATRLLFSSQIEDLRNADVYIVTVPTPIDEHHQPDLRPLIKASEMIGHVIKPGNVVIYESTVYPGATEEDCVPVIEQKSGLKYNVDFYAGYSPERINPGDKSHRLTNILKVTSGSNPDIAEFVDNLYKSIISAGTYKASSIKVAEAAKVIENTQRDLNIALINELAVIFNKMNIDTEEVLLAAGTKWNFLPFRPGLVGGHCIGVDPYYLTHKAQSIGYYPEVILAGRRINDNMASYVASQLVKQMIKVQLPIYNAKVLVLGLTFKENCPDIRNTKVIDIIQSLKEYGIEPVVYDPWVSKSEALREYNLDLVMEPQKGLYDAVIIAVNHEQFRQLGETGIRAFGKPLHVLYDLKYVLDSKSSDIRL